MTSAGAAAAPLENRYSVSPNVMLSITPSPFTPEPSEKPPARKRASGMAATHSARVPNHSEPPPVLSPPDGSTAFASSDDAGVSHQAAP